MALGLHEASHDAVGEEQVAGGSVGGHGGDDGVIGAFAGFELVRVSGLEGEACAAVLEGEAASGGDGAGAETGVVGGDEGAGWKDGRRESQK